MSIFDLFKRLEREKPALGPPEILVVGLGNPGLEYRETRHNAGFLTLDLFCEERGIGIKRLRFHALTGEGRVAGRRVFFLKPQTYMNNSGGAVREAVEFYKFGIEKVVVVQDDVALPCGRLRIREKGSAGGHNGIKDIIEKLGGDCFVRLKIGVGSLRQMEMVDHVLGKFSPNEQAVLKEAIPRACEALEEIIKNGAYAAANLYNADARDD